MHCRKWLNQYVLSVATWIMEYTKQLLNSKQTDTFYQKKNTNIHNSANNLNSSFPFEPQKRLTCTSLAHAYAFELFHLLSNYQRKQRPSGTFHKPYRLEFNTHFVNILCLPHSTQSPDLTLPHCHAFTTLTSALNPQRVENCMLIISSASRFSPFCIH